MTPVQLRRMLRRLGMNQVQCARFLGVDPRTVRRWVLGERRIPNPVETALRMLEREMGSGGQPKGG